MKTKNLVVGFLATVCIFLLAATISAAEVSEDIVVSVDGVRAASYDGTNLDFENLPGVVAGSEATVVVAFTAENSDTDVNLEVEIEGEKAEVREISSVFDVEEGVKYRKILKLKVPYELKDDISEDITLNIELDGKEHKTALADIPLRVQRPSYNTDIKSVSTSQSVSAGEKLPVDIVLKNIGYNDLDDLYVTVSISELGIQRSAYFGDLSNLESCDEDCDKEDTVSGRIYLDIPYTAKDGEYKLDVEVENDEISSKESKLVVIKNDFSNRVIVTSNPETVAIGENAEYTLLVVNPTNKLVVYNIVSESSPELSSTVSEPIVAIPAGASKTISVTAVANEEGKFNFNVEVLSNEESVGRVTLNTVVKGTQEKLADPVIVLTIVLAIIFLVLLVVLIVLLGRKPQSEDLGESYY